MTPADVRSPTRSSSGNRLNVPIRGGRLLTNPLPSLGGSIVAHVLGDLAGESHPAPGGLWREALVETTDWLKAQVTGTVSTTGTTHISVIDTDGLCAALTLSNGLGSGVVLPGTGIHLNNMMGEDDLHPGGAAAAVAG
ncbi:MAG: gamma-glutamyltransferase [Candidatus Nanopelagicales bacterium]